MKLYHYCCEHSVRAILQDSGVIRPVGLHGMSWFTDLYPPVREALALTSHTLQCDRMEHRFEVENSAILHWPLVRRQIPKTFRHNLESAPGVLPLHWYVAHMPVLALKLDGKEIR